MNNLDGFFKKFKSILGARGIQTELIAGEISQNIGAQISKESVSVRGQTVFVEGTPALKSQIFLKKTQILGALRKHPELKNISDVR